MMSKIDPALQGKNKYYEYLACCQNDRKMKYIEIMGKLSQDRQEFMRNPNKYKFNRMKNSISVLDSISETQAKLMYNSLKMEPKRNSISYANENSNKLWKSDLHKTNSEENSSPQSPPLQKPEN